MRLTSVEAALAEAEAAYRAQNKALGQYKLRLEKAKKLAMADASEIGPQLFDRIIAPDQAQMLQIEHRVHVAVSILEQEIVRALFPLRKGE